MHLKIQSLKQNLIRGTGQKKKGKMEIDPEDEIERKILADAIDEVSGLITVDPHELNIDNEHEPLMKTDNQQTWKSHMETPTDGTPSIHRNLLSNRGSVITLPEKSPMQVDQLEMMIPQLPETTDQEAADLGLYNTGIGRQLYDKINKVPQNVSMPLMPRNRQSIPLASGRLSEGILNTPEASEIAFVAPPDQSNVQQDVPNQPEIAQVQEQDLQDQQLNQKRGTRSLAGNSLRFEDSPQSSNNNSLFNRIKEDIMQEIDAGNALVKKPKKTRVRRIREPEVYSEVQKIHTYVVVKPRDIRSGKSYKPRIPYRFKGDLFEGADTYVPFERDFDEVDIEAVLKSMNISRYLNDTQEDVNITEPGNVQQQEQPNVAEMPMIPEIEPIVPDPAVVNQQHQTSITVPTPRNSIMRQRVSEVVQTPMNLQENVEVDVVLHNQPDPLEPQVAMDVAMVDLAQQAPKVSSSDIQFANHRRAHEVASTSQNVPKDPSRPVSSKNVHYREVQGKTETLVEFCNDGGKPERYSKYCMETVALFFQIRIILNQNNCTKMKFEELLPQLSLLDPNAPRSVFVRRLELLHDRKYLVLHFTEDDDIDEVEIEYDN